MRIIEQLDNQRKMWGPPRWPLGRAWYYRGHKRPATQRPSFDMVKLSARSLKRYNMLGFRLSRDES
jgi:hypothetical protein